MPEPEQPIRLLFVCTGNICRSPMAEGIARNYGRSIGHWLEVASASTLGLSGRPAERHAIAVCKEIDVDISHHQAQPLTDELLAWADHVLVMEYFHAAHIREHHADVGEKVVVLGAVTGSGEVPDPMGGWKFRFRSVRRMIQKAVETFIDRLPPPD